MPHVLHLLKPPISNHALSVIERQSREADTALTVVLSGDLDVPPLPPGVRVYRLAEAAGLTYSELLDLIFSADQVLTW